MWSVIIVVIEAKQWKEWRKKSPEIELWMSSNNDTFTRIELLVACRVCGKPCKSENPEISWAGCIEWSRTGGGNVCARAPPMMPKP